MKLQLFSPAEIAGRQEPGKRHGEPCPSCGTLGYTRLGMNFGLCQRDVTFCREGRQVTRARVKPVTLKFTHATLEYDVMGMLVTEVDPPDTRHVVYERRQRFWLDGQMLAGYRLEEWVGGTKIGDMDAGTVLQKILDVGHPYSTARVIERIQVLHPDRVIRIDNKP